MLTIQLNDGYLDVYTQDIDWTWETIRFSEGIRDQFSTDIEIPKTENNMHLLDVAGLLDSMTQPLGTQIAPCVMNLGDNVMDVYLQVVSVREEDITVCVFEKTLPNNILDTNIGKYVVDDDNSIFVWNVNTKPAYPNDFKTYWYGMGYNANYAQLHPSKDLNEVIQRVNAGAGINMPLSPSTKYVVATKKTVCPQNKMQIIEGHWTKDSGNYAVLSGGQHVTNNCEFSYSPDTTTITFNRKCKVTGKIYYAYKKRHDVFHNFPLYVSLHNPGEPVIAPSYFIPSAIYESFVMVGTFQLQIKEFSELCVLCYDTKKYDMLNFVLVLNITDYAITENDYGQELKYVGRTPRLKVYSNDGEFKFGSSPWQDMVDGSGGGYTYCWFDGTTYATHYNHTSNPAQNLTQAFTLEWCSIAYFGYWCNIPDIKVKELMWGLCWTDGKKLVNTTVHNMWMLNKVLQYQDANDTAIIDGWISETRISSDRLGKDNYILSKGQSEDQAEPISHIDNQWLENTKKLHESPFSYAPWRYGYWYCLDQYSDPEYDSESEEYKCKFEDVDGFAVAEAGTVQTLLYRLDFNKMGFKNMTQSIEVDIHTFNDVKNLDFVFLDGRKYMVIEGNTDLKTGESTLTALLVPYNPQQLEPDHDYPQEDEDHYEDDHEPSYPDDPNDDFDPNDNHPDYEDDHDYYEP